MHQHPSARVGRRAQELAGSRIQVGILVSGLWILNTAFSLGAWHGVYHDGPIAVRITPSKKLYHVGDTFRLSVTAINTSDRGLTIKRDWREQLQFYHLHPETGEQVEWPGRVLLATWVDSADVVRLGPGKSYTVKRDVRVWKADDAAIFPFRVKWVGVRDCGRTFNTWQGIAWSNAISLAVKPRP